MRRSIRAVLLFAMITGCGQAPSHLRGVDDPEKILLAVMGGNASCDRDSSPLGMSLFAPFDNLHKSLEESGQYKVDYFLSCHNTDARVHYATSNEPGQVYATDFAGAQAKIDALFAAGGAKRLILAGHSYGGWLAMKSATALQERLSLLVTIDPISRKTCTVLTPLGCVQAPTDIAHDERLAIKAQAEHWLNFWQDQTFYLHASEIPEADYNLEEVASHTQIGSLPDVWDRLGRAIKSRLTAH